MRPVEIESGPAKVIISGSVLSFGENPVIISFDKLQLIFTFKDEIDENGKKKKDFKMEVESLDDKTLKFLCINYNNPFGIGTVKPRRIGNYQGGPLYLNYIIYSDPTRESKLIQYTVYALKEINNEDDEKNE